MMIKAPEYYRKKNKKNIWCEIDTLIKKAPFTRFGGKNPTDCGKRGIKQSLIVDRKGEPLFIGVTPANKHDSKIFESALSKMKKSKQVRIMAADRSFDENLLRSIAKRKNIALIPSPNKHRNKEKKQI